jgi:hypothetical protein
MAQKTGLGLNLGLHCQRPASPLVLPPYIVKNRKKKTEQKIKCRKHNGRKNREVEKGEVIGRRWGKNAEIQI